MAVPVATALFLAGCSSSHKSASLSPDAQGAPAVVGQSTEVTTASGGAEAISQADIQLHKEEIVVGKREVSNGGVLIRTVVQTENLSQPVELRREEYVIERIPASEATAREALAKSADTAFQGREIYLPLTREEPVASKRVLLSEKVQLGKRIETDRQTVSTPIRSEEVKITKVAGKVAGDYWQESAPAAAAAPGEANSLNLLREEMVVGKTVVDNGGVKLEKVVHTQVASQPIELKREEFSIDRSPVSDPQVASADFSQKEIRLNLSREEPVVGTRIEPTEWVRVRKQINTDTKTVSGTVRKENIEIVKLAADQAAMGGTGTSGQSGATVISASGNAKLMTIQGTALCGQTELPRAGWCPSVIQVKDGDKPLNYYLVPNDVSKNFHENVCSKEGRKVTATGSVQELAGKLQFTPIKITLIE
jgi:uncharacterized protein (TIGR02271 family)